MKAVHPTFFFLLASQLLLSQNPETERYTPELLWSLARVSLYDVSPNGTQVLYGVTKYNISENRSYHDLYTIAADGSNDGVPLQLTNTSANEYEARFRPDGQKIGYLLGGNLWEINPDGTNARRVSDLNMNGFLYSPDGNKLLFITDVQYDKTTLDAYPDLPKANARIIDDLMYRHWDSWEDGAYSNIFVVDYDRGNLVGVPQNIVKEPFDTPLKPFGGMEQIAWSPDSRYIAYTCKKLKGVEAAISTNSDIYLYDLVEKTTTNLTLGMNGYDLNPAFSPDGRYLAWESQASPGYESDRHRIYVYDFVTKKKWELTSGLDQNAIEPQWSDDGQRIFFQSEIQGTVQLFSIDLHRGNQLTQHTEGQFNFGPFVISNNQLIALRCSMLEPHEIFRVPTDGSPSMQLTHTNKDLLAGVKSAKVEGRWMTTTDGKKMLTWIIYPPDFDPAKKYPALLYCQGGPQSTVSQFWSYRWNFQIMAANGYIVVAPNRRGLPSFGQDWNDAITGDWGGQAMQDLLTAIDEVAREPYVDAERLGAVGASFGGYSVFWLAGNHNKRFKAFIAHDGIFNLESAYGTTEELFFVNHDLEGPYWQQPMPETYRLDSPHKYVANWDTPILIFHGGKDFRIPDTEAMQAFTAARLLGIPARFVHFPEENHWVLTCQNGILWQREFFNWLDRWLK